MLQEVERFQMGVARFACRAAHGSEGAGIGHVTKFLNVGGNPGYVAGG